MDIRNQAKPDGFTLADRVVAQFGTRNPKEIARCAGVRIVYSRWAPVTIGEYEASQRTININLAALEGGFKTDSRLTPPDLEQSIIAHELGHHFMRSRELAVGGAETHRRVLTRREEEAAAHDFAERLLGISLCAQWEREGNA